MGRFIWKASFVIGIIAAVSIAGYIFILAAGSTMIDEKKLVMPSASRLVDSNGHEITRLYEQNREIVKIDKVPDHVQQAFVAVEDRRFYEHSGIDVKSIGRAVYKDLAAGGKVEGGSTITQQLAKNIFLSGEKSWLRKTKEAMLAINLENRYSKQELLEMYMNQLYFGHGAYGVEAASKYFFQKDVSELTVSEGALLASLPKAPSSYSPILHPEKAKERRDTVLSLMEEQGYLKAEEAVRLQGKTLGLNISKKLDHPWLYSYIDLVMDEAENTYDISNQELMRGGYTITVPLNQEIQKKAYNTFQSERYFPGTDKHAQASFVLLDNRTGGVMAVIGGRDYRPKGFNRVTAKRQPGSTFKPLAVFGPAMEEKLYEPYSLLSDSYQKYDGYAPENNDDRYLGQVTMYDALIKSKNAPAVWALNELGVGKSKTYLDKQGVAVSDKGLAIALGGLSDGVTPLQLAGAYRVFPESGVYTKPYFIQKIEDRHHKTVGEKDRKEIKVYSAQTAWNMTRMLQHVVSEGTAKSGSYSGELAGKTGTTSYPGKKGAVMDAWFAGYTPEVTGALWMGYDQTSPDRHLTAGSSYPTRLFKKILSESESLPKTAFAVPKGAEDLEDPIRLKKLNDVEANYAFEPLGLITVSLNWKKQEDPRVVYRIYEKDSGHEKLIGKVKNNHSYAIPFSNVFSSAAYKVVPYNEQTKQEGQGTGYVQPKIFSGR
ncbi:PBP1A family penicillin-binding protein [Bacillus sp. FJAT-42376]|uniref:transglycosylase domain-containing protein n=1 Tax=Bacillus sp. FJAT-42376 TaxID=2014076 RepID=UPI000F4FB3DB|nr:PBP1A family penicillin-binding protein [Bacillus sp. FJAT-42376]AZB42250.1 PBP1A family penicillin-binding protein [Bacillus sp. FJAT-42376]